MLWFLHWRNLWKWQLTESISTAVFAVDDCVCRRECEVRCVAMMPCGVRIRGMLIHSPSLLHDSSVVDTQSPLVSHIARHLNVYRVWTGSLCLSLCLSVCGPLANVDRTTTLNDCSLHKKLTATIQSRRTTITFSKEIQGALWGH